MGHYQRSLVLNPGAKLAHGRGSVHLSGRPPTLTARGAIPTFVEVSASRPLTEGNGLKLGS